MKAFLLIVALAIVGFFVALTMHNNEVDKQTSIEGLWPHRIEHIDRMNTLDPDQASFERQVATAMRQEVLNQAKNAVGWIEVGAVNGFVNATKEKEVEKKVLDDMAVAGGIDDLKAKIETMHDKTLKAQTATLMDKAGKLMTDVISTVNEVIDDPANAQTTVLKGVGKVLQGQKQETASHAVEEVNPVKP